jgi:molybdate transport system substrate-binding protein
MASPPSRMTLCTLALSAGLLAAACTPSPPPAVLVGAASDLAPALPDLRAAFQAGTGLDVEFTVGSSGQIAAQIDRGAPIDVFMSAHADWVDWLEARGRIAASTRAVYAVGRLVVLARDPAARPGSAERLRTAIDDGARVAIANPAHAPYGRAAREALERMGLWTAAEPRIVHAENVRAALRMVESGNADVGVIARSLALEDETGSWLVPDSLHAPLLQTLVLAAGAPGDRGVARAWTRFVLGPEGRAILVAHGFEPPPERAP